MPQIYLKKFSFACIIAAVATTTTTTTVPLQLPQIPPIITVVIIQFLIC